MTVKMPSDPSLDVVYSRIGTHIELDSIENHVPEGKKMFFGEFRFLKLSVQGKFQRSRCHHFLPWKLRYRTPYLIVLDGYIAELFLDGAQRGADAGRTGSDNQDIVDTLDPTWHAFA